jgi:hypothetical protein
MDSMDNFRERFEALEKQTEQLKYQTQALEAQTQELKAHNRTVERRLRWWCSLRRVVAVAALGLALALPLPVWAKTFHCGAGDVQCLIDAINEANANGKKNTIRLEAGTYTLKAVDNNTLSFYASGDTGLPVVTSTLAIQGVGADTTILERDASAPFFRIFGVADTGTLVLERLTIQRGGPSGPGGGVLNVGGKVIIRQAAFVGNEAGGGAGLHNAGGGVTITQSTFRDNDAFVVAGGLLNVLSGTVTITQSTFTGNRSPGEICGGGGGLCSFDGTVTITDSTFADNSAPAGGALQVGDGTALLVNTTVAANSGGGIARVGGTVLLVNTIVAHNTPNPQGGSQGSDCAGTIISAGTNLIGDPTGCTITLQPTDLTGDPGLDTFTDNGTPGNGHFPLLPTSQAIDAGNDAVCPQRDQLGQRRMNIQGVGTSICDIGSIEFHPPHGEDPAAVSSDREDEAP